MRVIVVSRVLFEVTSMLDALLIALLMGVVVCGGKKSAAGQPGRQAQAVVTRFFRARCNSM
jgi:hypothetical protein